jgi:membrane-associated protease RseP (regulator of RpoE activity)
MDRSTATFRALLFATLLLCAAIAGGAAAQMHWPFDEHFMPHRGRIGVQVQPMTPELREHFEAPSDRGLLVTRVEEERPADRAGLRVGDIIVEAAEEPMERPMDLVQVVARAPSGESFELRVVRDGETKALKVEPEGEAVQWADPEHWGDKIREGMRWGGEEMRRRLEELERRLEKLERDLRDDGSSSET